jgi:capsular polysaccharide biosynthesis protein
MSSLFFQVRWGASPPQAGKNTLGIGIISYAESVCITIAADHVKGKHSEGVAHRLTDKFEQRWKQYIQVADEILARSEKSKQRHGKR